MKIRELLRLATGKDRQLKIWVGVVIDNRLYHCYKTSIYFADRRAAKRWYRSVRNRGIPGVSYSLKKKNLDAL